MNYLYGITTVPLYDSLGPENISYCIEHSGIETICASKESIDVLLSNKDAVKLVKTIIAYDPITD